MPTKAGRPAAATFESGSASKPARAGARDHFRERITWSESDDAEFPYFAFSRGEALAVRLNDFPDDCLYTLFVNSAAVADFDDWPENWERP